MNTWTTAAGVMALVAGVASGQVTLREIKRIDVTGSFGNGSSLGSSAAAVAWNGSDLYVAGFDNFSGSTSTGILRISNALGAVQTTTSFGVSTTVDGRGYSGLALRGNQLVAAYDNGSNAPNGIAAYDTGTLSVQWQVTTRGGSGVAYDPGFNGGAGGAGVAWTTFGSGRRALQDAATGASLFTTSNGMIINLTGTTFDGGTTWRDLDFSANGDLFARRSNGILKTTRTGDNSGTVSTLVAPQTGGAGFPPPVNATNINGQNLDVIEGSAAGSFVIYNDRPTGSSTQDLTSVIRAIGLDGTSQSVSITGLSGFNLGNGYYDFSYDLGTNTLAVSDFANNQVYIFRVVPAPAVGMVAGLGVLVGGRRRR